MLGQDFRCLENVVWAQNPFGNHTFAFLKEGGQKPFISDRKGVFEIRDLEFYAAGGVRLEAILNHNPPRRTVRWGLVSKSFVGVR